MAIYEKTSKVDDIYLNEMGDVKSPDTIAFEAEYRVLVIIDQALSGKITSCEEVALKLVEFSNTQCKWPILEVVGRILKHKKVHDMIQMTEDQPTPTIHPSQTPPHTGQQ